MSDQQHPQSGALRGFLWRVVGRPVFLCTPRTAYRARRWLLQRFGATLAPSVKFRKTCDIDRPWNLTVGPLTMFGDDTLVRAGSPIAIGRRCVISQYSMLLTSTMQQGSDKDAREFQPITIGDDCWIATDCVVLPGAQVPDGVVVGARSLVDAGARLDPWTIATGEPAVSRKQRPRWQEDRQQEGGGA